MLLAALSLSTTTVGSLQQPINVIPRNQPPLLTVMRPTPDDKTSKATEKVILLSREKVGSPDVWDFLACAWEFLPDNPTNPITKRVTFAHSSWNPDFLAVIPEHTADDYLELNGIRIPGPAERAKAARVNVAGFAGRPGILGGDGVEGRYAAAERCDLSRRIATNNVELKQALETYLAARDQVIAARANLYPTLSANATTLGQKYSANQALWNKANPTTFADLTIAGQASWEPDFWGRIRRTVEQARAQAQASAAEAASVDLTLHAELATDYFALRGLDSEIKLLTATVADLERQLDLTQRRFAGGVATAVDVAQARTQLETVRAQLGTWAWPARNTSTPSEPSPTTIFRASAFHRRRSIWRCP